MPAWRGTAGPPPAYDDSGWAGVRPLARDLATLVAPSGPPVRRIPWWGGVTPPLQSDGVVSPLLAPAAITISPSGRTIVDFGQNLVGRLRLTVSGPAGQTITLRHAEVLENGELCTRPLRGAKATDRYTLRRRRSGDLGTALHLPRLPLC